VKNFHSASESICEYKVSQLVNEYIDLGVLKTTGFSSDSFVIVSRNPEGQVTSVETNTMEVNRFAAVLSENILKEIKERQEDKIKAPVGAFTGNGLLSSLGFFISYRVIPEGKVTVSPSSFFDNAGINQTVHRLQMDVLVDVKILFPMMKREERVNRTVIISETVIIGDVPKTLMTRGQ
jgi:sporulation protein YunB